jgi:hypothetical protein
MVQHLKKPTRVYFKLIKLQDITSAEFFKMIPSRKWLIKIHIKDALLNFAVNDCDLSFFKLHENF